MAGVELKNSEAVERAIKGYEKRLKFQAPAWKVIKQQALADILKHFRDESSPTGKWKPSKRALEHGGKTLQDTGRLRNGTVAKSGADRVIVTNNVNYGSYHNNAKPGSKMPKRQFFWISDKAIQLMLKTMSKFIMGK